MDLTFLKIKKPLSDYITGRIAPSDPSARKSSSQHAENFDAVRLLFSEGNQRIFIDEGRAAHYFAVNGIMKLHGGEDGASMERSGQVKGGI